jgi:hypothetical protein
MKNDARMTRIVMTFYTEEMTRVEDDDVRDQLIPLCSTETDAPLIPSGSTSQPGASTCYCIGLNRVYMEGGLCVCTKGYVAYDENFNLIADGEDGQTDCQPNVLKRCDTGEVGMRAYEVVWLYIDTPRCLSR